MKCTSAKYLRSSRKKFARLDIHVYICVLFAVLVISDVKFMDGCVNVATSLVFGGAVKIKPIKIYWCPWAYLERRFSIFILVLNIFGGADFTEQLHPGSPVNLPM